MRVFPMTLWLLSATVASAQVAGQAQRSQMKPYSMVQRTTSTRLFANGLTQTSTSELLTMRDADGRMRYEREAPGAEAYTSVADGRSFYHPARETFRMIEVYDPVEKVSYNWTTDPNGEHEVTVRRDRNQPMRPRPSQTSAKPGEDTPVVEAHTEKLGQRSFPGVTAEGTRTVSRYPAGYNGVDHAYEVTSEYWNVPGLGVQVASSTEDPRTGKTVTTLVSFSDQPPDPSLLRPPADYKRVEMEPVPPQP